MGGRVGKIGTKGVQQRPPYTPEHNSTWNYSCTNTLTPMLTLSAACPKLHTTFPIGLETQKRYKTRLLCLDKPVLRQRGGGGYSCAQMHHKGLQSKPNVSPACMQDTDVLPPDKPKGGLLSRKGGDSHMDLVSGASC